MNHICKGGFIMPSNDNQKLCTYCLKAHPPMDGCLVVNMQEQINQLKTKLSTLRDIVHDDVPHRYQERLLALLEESPND